jgi:hypothetical protein
MARAGRTGLMGVSAKLWRGAKLKRYSHKTLNLLNKYKLLIEYKLAFIDYCG